MATLAVNSSTDDGYVKSTNATYATARAGSGLTSATNQIAGNVGQVNFYDIWELFLDFDTSSIDDSATVSSAILNTDLSSDGSTTDFEARCGLFDWGTGLTTADWQDGTELAALTQLCHLNTSAMGSVGTNTNWVDDAFAANINKTGETRVVLFSAETENNSSNVNDEYVSLSLADAFGTSDDPLLTVTYSVPQTITLTGTLGLSVAPVAPTRLDQAVSPAAAGLTLGAPAPALVGDQAVSPAALALALGRPAPAVAIDQTLNPGALALPLGTPAPQLDQEVRLPMRYAEAVLDGLVGYWRTGEASGTVMAAVVGPAGTYAGSPMLGVPGLLTGDADTAVTFDGANDRGDFAGVDLTAGDWTMMAWVAPISVTDRAIFGASSGGFELLIQNSRVVVRCVGQAFASPDNTVVLLAGARALLAATYVKSTTTLSYFINGSAGRVASYAPAFTPGALTRTIAVSPTEGRWFAGTIDEPRVYNRALSAGEIAELYSIGANGPGLALSMGQPAPQLDQRAELPAIALTLGSPAPAVAIDQTVILTALTLALGLPAPAVAIHQEIGPAALALLLAQPPPRLARWWPLSATFYGRGDLFGRLYPAGAGMGIEVEVWDPQFNPPRMIATLQGARAAGWQDVLNEVGSFGFTIPLADAKAGPRIISRGNMVKFRLHGQHRFGGWIEQLQPTRAAIEGPAGEHLAVAGPGLMGYLRRARIPPPDATLVGYIAVLLQDEIDEAVTRGVLPLITTDWDATTDSSGAAWDDTATWAFTWGTSTLEDVRQAAVAMGVEFRMTPDLLLQAYEDGLGTDRSSVVVLRNGWHLRADVAPAWDEGTWFNVVLVRAADGSAETVYGDHSDPRRGRREGVVDFAASNSRLALRRAGAAALRASAAQAEAVRLSLHHGIRDGHFEPYLDYELGDVVGLAIPGLPATTRVAAISIAGTDDGGYTVDIDGNALRGDNIVRLRRLVQDNAGTLIRRLR